MVRGMRRLSSTSSARSLVMKGPSARVSSGSSESMITKSECQVFDAALAFVHCSAHHKFAFCKVSSWKGLYLPVAVVSPLDGFDAGIVHRMKQLLQHPDSAIGYIGHRIHHSPLQYMRIQVPVVGAFVTRVSFQVDITGSPDGLCCKDVFTMEWLTADQVLEHKDRFWGPEVLSLVTMSSGRSSAETPFQELTLKDQVTLSHETREQVAKVGYNEADVQRIFNDFFQHCFPSTRMSRSSLQTYVTKTGIVSPQDHKRMDSVCEAFFSSSSSPEKRKREQFLTFTDFLTGLSLVDSESTIPFPVKGYRSFRNAAAKHEAMENMEIDESFSEVVTKLSTGTKGGKAVTACPKCESESMTYASYAVTLTADSVIMDPLAIVFNDEDQKRVATRAISREQVDHTSIGNVVIRWIHDDAELQDMSIAPFATGVSSQQAMSLWSRDLQVLADYVMRMCAFVRRVMLHESRLVDLVTPVYAIGSLFGSMVDLLTFERLFWKRGIQFEAGHYVFLANYAEHAYCHSLQVLFYLLAIKSLAPNKVTLLRGQTEQRSRIRCVRDQLKLRFGDTDLMRKVRESICSVFDCMPIAAVVNGSTLLTPANLPACLTNLRDVNRMIPVPLSNPDSHPLAKEFLSPTRSHKDLDDENADDLLKERMSRLGLKFLIHSRWSLRSITRHVKGKVISFISSSNVKGSGNPASVLLIIEKKIRNILILDPKHPLRSESQSSLALSAKSSSGASSSSSNPGSGSVNPAHRLASATPATTQHSNHSSLSPSVLTSAASQPSPKANDSNPEHSAETSSSSSP